MGIKTRHIAVICDYKLLESRIGGMDYFFWVFNKECKAQYIQVDWFFPNKGAYGEYEKFNIIPSGDLSIEQSFINHIKSQEIQYSHIITHFIELCTSFFLKVSKCQKATVITVDHNPRPFGGYPLKKRFKKALKGRLYSKYINQFIGVSNYTSDEIIKDFGSFLKRKTKTVYNGVFIENIIPKTSERKLVNPRFMVVSHLRPSKGIQDLIEAVAFLPENQKKKLAIDIYGEGTYKNELLKLIAKHHVQTVFNFKGNQSNINELYQEYDYLIQPTHMECFSLSILESLAANIPVITTPVGGNLEIIEDGKNGFIFEAKNINDLASLLKSIINGEKSITGNTRTLIENEFSIKQMVKNHLSLLG